MAVVDDFSPIYCGDTGTPLIPQFKHKDGSVVNLDGATITMIMQDVDHPTEVKNATGTWSIVDATNGIARFHYSSADVSEEGTFNLIIRIEVGGEPVHADARHLVIEALPVVTVP